MNDLNSQQIVLLTLLVSFVTSIATGIVTVSLLEQAPEPVTQTINRVVEKTVERVVEVEGEKPGTVETIIETVIVKEEDLTIEAVNKNSRSLVRIFSVSGTTETFVGLGIVTSESGEIISDSQNLNSDTNYVGKFQTGDFPLELVSREANNPFAKLKATSESTFSPASFSNSQNLKLGQSVIALSGQISNSVSTGIVTSLITSAGSIDETESGSESIEEVISIETSVNGNKIIVGSILLNLQGQIVGAKINGDPLDTTSFMPANRISDFLATPAATE